MLHALGVFSYEFWEIFQKQLFLQNTSGRLLVKNLFFIERCFIFKNL